MKRLCSVSLVLSKMRNMEKNTYQEAIDNYSAWPTSKKVFGFLRNYIAQYGIPKQIRSDQGTVFTREKFKLFCCYFQLSHITCPVLDHRGNGKIERIIRTINERLRTNNSIILKKDNQAYRKLCIRYGWDEEKRTEDRNLKKMYVQEPNTVKSITVDKI